MSIYGEAAMAILRRLKEGRKEACGACIVKADMRVTNGAYPALDCFQWSAQPLFVGIENLSFDTAVPCPLLMRSFGRGSN